MTWPKLSIESLRAETPYSLVGGPFGSELTTRDYVEEGVPVIRGVNLPDDNLFRDEDFVYVTEEKADRLASHIAYPGDVIFTQRGTLGQVGMIPYESRFPRYVVSQSQMKLTADPETAEPKFIYYFFRCSETIQTIRNHALTSGVPHINLGILREFRMPLPPLDVQRRIVDILSAYDDLIENNRRRMALLDEAARQLYQEWFVRLRFPGSEHTPIVDGLPEGWRRKRLADLAKITMGQSPPSEYYNDYGEGLPFHQGVSSFDDRFAVHQVFCTLSQRTAEAGDILISVRAPVGRLNITLDKIVIGRGLAALHSTADHQSLLFQQLRAHFFKEDLIGAGAIFAAVTKKELEDQEFVSPDERVARAFEEIVRPFDDQLRVLFQQNRRLRSARDLLLPRLMSGEITA